MTQKSSKTEKRHLNFSVNKLSQMAKLTSIVEEVSAIQTRKNTPNRLQIPTNIKERNPQLKMKEGKKPVSPLREMMKNRNLQREQNKSKRVITRVQPIFGNSARVEKKDNLTKTDKTKKEESNVICLNNCDKTNIANIKISQSKMNTNGKVFGTKPVGVIKKNARLTGQYNLNSPLKKKQGKDGGRNVTKYSKFLEETHKNINTMKERDEGPESAGEADVGPWHSERLESPERFIQLIDKTVIDSQTAFFNDDVLKSLIENGFQNLEFAEPYSDENYSSAENSDEELDFPYECENFIRSNFSFPVLAVGCISMVVLLLRHYNP